MNGLTPTTSERQLSTPGQTQTIPAQVSNTEAPVQGRAEPRAHSRRVPQGKSLFSGLDWRTYRSVIALLAVMAVLAILTQGTFLTPRNLTNLTRQVALNGILANPPATYDPAVQKETLIPNNCVEVGGVSYGFNIGETEITTAQWVTFLNTADPLGKNGHHLWDAAESSSVWPKYGSVNVNRKAPRGQRAAGTGKARAPRAGGATGSRSGSAGGSGGSSSGAAWS